MTGKDNDTCGPIGRYSSRTFYIRSGQGEDELDGDYIEELGELDDVGDLNDIGSLEDPPLNQNVGETGADDSDIDDDSFMGESLSESSEREDSLDDDYEIHEDTEVIDEEEDNLDYGDPVEERLRLSQLDGFRGKRDTIEALAKRPHPRTNLILDGREEHLIHVVQVNNLHAHLPNKHHKPQTPPNLATNQAEGLQLPNMDLE
ncbi:hypothetical protein K1719_032284 [Acacia pycnantha]|nr:hypothetical protein K1719_032284 [Acacia pycnantha]